MKKMDLHFKNMLALKKFCQLGLLHSRGGTDVKGVGVERGGGRGAKTINSEGPPNLAELPVDQNNVR